MTRRGRMRRMRMLRAYKLGVKHARAIMQKDLDQMRASLEGELASLRVAVRELQAEHSRAQEIVSALETEREFGTRLQ
jgi:peptidoglycan hydrolase CwlO-like protein